jgi:hypothetical protein
MLKGFFRGYELHYVVADERDAIRLRSNFRHDPPEQVYVYRVKASVESGRRLFLEYLRQLNELRQAPTFYNSLTSNCSSNLWVNARIKPTDLPLSWKILASGHMPEYLFEQDMLLGEGKSFAELQTAAHINARAQAAGQAADFSQRIRAPAAGEIKRSALRP